MISRLMHQSRNLGVQGYPIKPSLALLGDCQVGSRAAALGVENFDRRTGGPVRKFSVLDLRGRVGRGNCDGLRFRGAFSGWNFSPFASRQKWEGKSYTFLKMWEMGFSYRDLLEFWKDLRVFKTVLGVLFLGVQGGVFYNDEKKRELAFKSRYEENDPMVPVERQNSWTLWDTPELNEDAPTDTWPSGIRWRLKFIFSSLGMAGFCFILYTTFPTVFWTLQVFSSPMFLVLMMGSSPL